MPAEFRGIKAGESLKVTKKGSSRCRFGGTLESLAQSPVNRELQNSPFFLISFNRPEKGSKIPFAKRQVIFSLDNFKENRSN